MFWLRSYIKPETLPTPRYVNIRSLCLVDKFPLVSLEAIELILRIESRAHSFGGLLPGGRSWSSKDNKEHNRRTVGKNLIARISECNYFNRYLKAKRGHQFISERLSEFYFCVFRPIGPTTITAVHIAT